MLCLAATWTDLRSRCVIRFTDEKFQLFVWPVGNGFSVHAGGIAEILRLRGPRMASTPTCNFPVLLLSYVGPQHAGYFYACLDSYTLLNQQSELFDFRTLDPGTWDIFADLYLSSRMASSLSRNKGLFVTITTAAVFFLKRREPGKRDRCSKDEALLDEECPGKRYISLR